MVFNQISAKIKTILENRRIKRNVSYIKNNSKKVLAYLKTKAKTGKIRVAFLCSEPAKWKCQTLYDLMLKDEKFEPFILATRADTPVQDGEFAHKTYEYFKSKNMDVRYAYDLETGKYIHSKDFGADLIFYQQPWSNETTQGPVVASKYALTYYVPYFIATSVSWIEYGLRFHSYLHKHYVLNQEVYNSFKSKMENKGENLTVAGNPQLDYFYFNKEQPEKKYVIFAPHHSIDDGRLNWATFRWSAKYILEYAKIHPEINWIFRPHPALKTSLIKTKTMTQEEINAYWDEWAKVGIVSEEGDYLDLFKKTKALITDCGSFLTEFMYVNSPIIHLERKEATEFNSGVKKIVESSYRVFNIQELESVLDKVVVNNIDDKKEEREKILKELDIPEYSAKNILENIKQELNLNK